MTCHVRLVRLELFCEKRLGGRHVEIGKGLESDLIVMYVISVRCHYASGIGRPTHAESIS
jgi:hypothetical protein